MTQTQRIVIGAIIASITLIAFAVFVQNYVARSRALAPEARATVTPLGNGQFSLLVKPTNSTQKISIMDIFMEAEGGEVSGWDGCKAPGDDKLVFNELGRKTGPVGRYSCSLIKDTAQLPNTVVLSGRVACKDPKMKSVKLKVSSKSSVGGPIEGVQYGLVAGEAVEIPCDGGVPVVKKDVLMAIATATAGVEGCNVQIGEKCSLGVLAKTSDSQKTLSALYMKLGFDSSIVEFQESQIVSAYGEARKIPQVVLGELNRRLLAQTNSDPSTISGIPTLIPEPTVTATPTATLSPTPVVTSTPIPSATPSSVLTPTTFPSPTITPTATPTVTPSPDPLPGKNGCVLYYAYTSGSGEVEFLSVCARPARDLPRDMGFDFGFKGLSKGKGQLEVLSVQAVGPASSSTGRVQLYTVAKASAPYSVGAGKANVELDMRLRLQCVVKKPKGAQKLNVRVGIADGKLKKPIFETGEFTVDSQGFWNGKISFNVPEGTQYKLLVKGDKHMQKKICDSAPQEDYPGAYRCDKGRMTIKDGTQFVDLSKIVLVTGDLPPGEQDGISNAKDQSLVRNLIGKTDPESAKLADINYDGVVNAVDHSCMIAALSVRWDEE